MRQTIKYLGEVIMTIIVCTCNRPNHTWQKEDVEAATEAHRKLLRLLAEGFIFENVRNIIFLAACVILLILNLRGISVYAGYENYQAQRVVTATLSRQDVGQAVRRVAVETDNPDIRNITRKVDFRDTTHVFTITFAPDSITNRQHFAAQTYAIIQALRAGGFAPEIVTFWYYGNGFNYLMQLEGERINLDPTGLEGRIHEKRY